MEEACVWGEFEAACADLRKRERGGRGGRGGGTRAEAGQGRGVPRKPPSQALRLRARWARLNLKVFGES